MNRRTFVALAAAPLLRAGSGAFPGIAYRDYFRCLPDHLKALAAEAYARRSAAIAALTSPAAISARQHWARETFWELAGGMPERTPLNTKTIGELVRPRYRIEKLVYESQPGLYVTANLYLPKDARPPFPGVLFQMGHAKNGKAYDSYQRCCQGLVQLGYLVLAFDPIGQGERVCYPSDDPAHSRLESVDDEHSMAGWQMLLHGDTMTRLQVWDAIRSLDVLAAHPLVDPARLASTGQSGGATVTMMLSCVDDRLSTAVVASGNTENFACAGFDAPGSTDDAEQNLLGSGPRAFDRWDLLYPMAPKPLLVMVSDKDWFGTYSPAYLRSGHEEFSNLQRVYEHLGHPEQLAWADTPLPHSLAYDSRLRIYNWFARWLKQDTRPVEKEPPTAPDPERSLWVTPSGSVVHDLGGLTPFQRSRARVKKVTPVDLATFLHVQRPSAGCAFTVLGATRSRELRIEAVEVPAAPQVWLPAWVMVPDSSAPSAGAYLLLDAKGRNSRWHEGELFQELTRSGSPVCVPDLRGTGDLDPEFGRGAAIYAGDHQTEESYAWASLILGQTMLGQWVTDVLAAVDAFRNHPAARGRRLVLAASGKLTVPALAAATLDPQISALYLSGGLVSFESVAETENFRCSLANFVPSFLEHTDLPDLAHTIRPRKLVLAGSVDGAGNPLAVDAVRRLYPDAQVFPDAGWTVEAITRAAV